MNFVPKKLFLLPYQGVPRELCSWIKAKIRFFEWIIVNQGKSAIYRLIYDLDQKCPALEYG